MDEAEHVKEIMDEEEAVASIKFLFLAFLPDVLLKYVIFRKKNS